MNQLKPLRHPKTICIDFDGTIAHKIPFGKGEIVTTPHEGAAELIGKLYQKYNIIIFSVRVNPIYGSGDSQKHKIAAFLKTHGIPYDLITSRKPKAFAYIDDRAIRFTNWRDVYNYFL